MGDVTQLTIGGQVRNIKDAEARRILQQANRLYVGQDLTVKFSTEIAAHASPWDWIKARITAGNYEGVNIGDFIPMTLTDGKVFLMEVAGINTYRRYGDFEVGNHIDFISRDCHPDTMVWNRVNYNNGIAGETSPWKASDLYHKLNSLQGSVPNATVAEPAILAVDYRTTGVYDKLPANLRNVIVQKRLLLPRRYSAGALLIDDNSWDWKDAGFLWVPSEVEVYGCTFWGSNLSPNQGWSGGMSVQYPIFANNMKRVKGAGNGGGRSHWWLLSARGGYSTYACAVGSNGYASSASASHASIRAPLCFRIA